MVPSLSLLFSVAVIRQSSKYRQFTVAFVTNVILPRRDKGNSRWCRPSPSCSQLQSFDKASSIGSSPSRILLTLLFRGGKREFPMMSSLPLLFSVAVIRQSSKYRQLTVAFVYFPRREKGSSRQCCFPSAPEDRKLRAPAPGNS